MKTKGDLIKTFSEANKILRKDGLSEGKERFVEFANLLFLKILNDIDNQNENNGEKRKLDKMYSWDYFKNKNAEDMYVYIRDTVFKQLAVLYNKRDEILFNNVLNISKPNNLKAVVDKIETLGDLTKLDTDVKGDAFEFFLKNSISVGDDLGEYFTPRHIVKLMIELIDLKFGEKIYDPCCGTGGFLTESFKDLYKKCAHTSKNIKTLKEETVYGVEITNTAKIAKMNMILIGDGHNNIIKQDCLEFPVVKQYDVVLSNFAFSQQTDYSDLYGYSGQDANPIFLSHIFKSLKDDGRAAVVVPEGILFDTKEEYVKIRKEIFTNSKIVAIIRLHKFVFRPYTGQPTSIIIFNKKEKRTDKVWFFDIEEDGFKKTTSITGRKPIKSNDIPLLLKSWNNKLKTEKSFFVSGNVIEKDKKYILSLAHYIKETTYNVPTVKLKELLRDNKAILGYTPERKNDNNWKDGNYPWVKIGDIDINNMFISETEEKITQNAVKKNKILPPNTLLYSIKLSIGKVAITTKSMCTNEAIVGLIIDDELIRKYLYYILPHIHVKANRAAKGLTLNKTKVENLIIPYDKNRIPQIVEQLENIQKEKQKMYQKIQYYNTTINTYINNEILK